VSLHIDPVTATLVVALIGVFGALAGVVVERLLRLAGRLRLTASGWDRTFHSQDPGWGVGLVPDEDLEKDTTKVDFLKYRVDITLFNGREVPTGLQDIKIVLVHEDGRRGEPSRPEGVAVINVPPRQFAHKELTGTFAREEAQALATGNWQRVEFEAQRPKRPLLWRKTYRKTIATP
jgi:hypothetical protein